MTILFDFFFTYLGDRSFYSVCRFLSSVRLTNSFIFFECFCPGKFFLKNCFVFATKSKKFFVKICSNVNRPNFHRTGSMASRTSEESKKSRVFGSLLRRHTSFGAPDGAKISAPPTISAPIIQSDANRSNE